RAQEVGHRLAADEARRRDGRHRDSDVQAAGDPPLIARGRGWRGPLPGHRAAARGQHPSLPATGGNAMSGVQVETRRETARTGTAEYVLDRWGHQLQRLRLHLLLSIVLAIWSVPRIELSVNAFRYGQ